MRRISTARKDIDGLDASKSGIDWVAATYEPTIGGAIERIGVRPRPPREYDNG
ncbi:hypothetical protein FWH09_03030 [Candidatus Saccharibacteria bacterium]|nr:hypothetical protein [Candidatus Saccharibacteria bacterium]